MAATISASKSRSGRSGISSKKKKVCALVYDKLCTFEYGIVVEAFALPREGFDDWYEFEAVAIDKGPIRGLGNVTVQGNSDLEVLKTADLIIVPGWRGAKQNISPETKQALLGANARGAQIASICSGAFVLAQCGLLDGRRATTHWRHVQALQDLYPKINVDSDVLYVDDDRVLTSAGSSAGIDLCLHIIRKDYGATIANTVAKRFVIPAHRNGDQPQIISRPHPRFYRGNIAPLLDKILESLNEDWGIARMANETHSSARTLQRRFKDATGQSPHMWVTIERIKLAKDLLETTNLNVQQIANVTGLKTPETVRHHFKRLTGVSPTRFRADFFQNKQHD